MDTIIRQTIYAIVASLLLTGFVWILPPLRKWFDISFFKMIGHPEFFREFVKIYAHSNPGQKWAEFSVEVDGNLETIPYPTWDCWLIYHSPDMVKKLGSQFLEKYGSKFEKNSKLCAITNPALFFLGSIDDWLRKIGAYAFPLEKSYPLASSWTESDLVLFDINLNSGRTMLSALEFFKKKGWEPSYLVVVLYNDLVPENDVVMAKLNVNNKFRYVLKASDVIEHWVDQEAALSVKIVQRALRKELPWSDYGVQAALRYIRTYPNVGVPSGFMALGESSSVL